MVRVSDTDFRTPVMTLDRSSPLHNSQVSIRKKKKIALIFAYQKIGVLSTVVLIVRQEVGWKCWNENEKIFESE